MISDRIERVIVADANVLLSALALKAASRVLQHDLEICVTEHTMGEIEKYLPRFAGKYGIGLNQLRRAFSMMPVAVKSESSYRRYLKKAGDLIGKRDIGDLDVLALALSLDATIWSNDNDFNGLGVKIYTTAKLLSILER